MEKAPNERLGCQIARFGIAIIIFIVLLSSMIWFRPYRVHTGLQIEGQADRPTMLWLSVDVGRGFQARQSITQSPQEGSFEIEWPLPRKSIRGIRIDSGLAEAPTFKVQRARIGIRKKGSQPVELKTDGDKLSNSYTFRRLDIPNKGFKANYFGVQICLAFLISFIALLLLDHLKIPGQPSTRPSISTRIPSKSFWIFFFLVAAVLSVWLMGLWPGVVTGDTFFTWARARDANLHDPAGYVYTASMLGMSILWTNVAVLGILQIVVTSLLAAYIFSRGWRQGPIKFFMILFAIFFCLSAPISIRTITYDRDTFFALGSAALAIFVFHLITRKWYAKNEPAPAIHLVGLSLLLTFVVLQRKEAQILILLAPIIVFFTGALTRRQTVWFSALSLVLFGIFGVYVPIHVRSDDDSLDRNAYIVTGVISPLTSIYLDEYAYWPDPELSHDVMTSIFDVDVLRCEYDPNNILWYHYNRKKHHYTDQDIDRLIQAYLDGVLHNPQTFMANRSYIFFSMLGSNRIEHMVDDVIDHIYTNRERARTIAQIKTEYMWHWASRRPAFETLRETLENFIKWSKQKGPFYSNKMLIWNSYPQVLALLGVLLLCRKIPATALVSLLISFRLPLLFLTAPASHFKYMYSFYFFGLLIIPMALIEWRLRRYRRERS